MDFGNILRTIGRRGLLILLFVLLGVGVAAFTQLELTSEGIVPKTGKFRATTQIYIDLPRLDPDAANTAVMRLVLTPAAHAKVMESQQAAEEISSRVSGAYSTAEIHGNLAAYAQLPASILVIDVSGDSPSDAIKLAKAAAATYVDWLGSRQDAAGVPERNRMTAEVLDEANEATVSSTAGQVGRWLIFGGVVGATLGIVLAFGMAPPEHKPKVHKLGASPKNPRSLPVHFGNTAKPSPRSAATKTANRAVQSAYKHEGTRI